MRLRFRTLPLILLLVCAGAALPVGPAGAVTKDVDMQDNAFMPATVTIGQGGSIRWTNQDGVSHTATSNNGFWNTPQLQQGENATRDFPNAGRFAYHCLVHGFSMSGVVKVPMKKSGSPGNGWTIRWSSLASTPDSRGFDVQIDRPGSSSGFEAFRTNTQARKAFFNPSQNGTYGFRARTDNRSNGESSGFSPVMSLLIS